MVVLGVAMMKIEKGPLKILWGGNSNLGINRQVTDPVVTWSQDTNSGD